MSGYAKVILVALAYACVASAIATPLIVTGREAAGAVVVVVFLCGTYPLAGLLYEKWGRE